MCYFKNSVKSAYIEHATLKHPWISARRRQICFVPDMCVFRVEEQSNTKWNPAFLTIIIDRCVLEDSTVIIFARSLLLEENNIVLWTLRWIWLLPTFQTTWRIEQQPSKLTTVFSYIYSMRAESHTLFYLTIVEWREGVYINKRRTFAIHLYRVKTWCAVAVVEIFLTTSKVHLFR